MMIDDADQFKAAATVTHQDKKFRIEMMRTLQLLERIIYQWKTYHKT